MSTAIENQVTIHVDQPALYEGLKMVSGVIESSQVMQVLSFVHIEASGHVMKLTATNAEVEVQTSVTLKEPLEQPVALTLPCKKLMDMLRLTDKEQSVRLTLDGMQVVINMSSSQFKVNTLEADQFPFFNSDSQASSFDVVESEFLQLLKRTSFAMASQDVRYFLNGMLLQISGSELKTVATDGHRLAVNAIEIPQSASDQMVQAVIPRKTILELTRLLTAKDSELKIFINADYFEIQHENFTLRSNLIDAQYPDFQKLIPRQSETESLMKTQNIRHALNRVAILANEKFRGVRCHFKADQQLILESNNMDQEAAVEVIDVIDGPDDFQVAFNINYLMDILNIVETENVLMRLSGPEAGVVLMEQDGLMNSIFVVMPLTL